MFGGANYRELNDIAAQIDAQVDRLRALGRKTTSRKVMAFSLQEIREHAEMLADAAVREHLLRRMRENYIACDLFGEAA